MAQLEGMVLSGERQCSRFTEVAELAAEWGGDRVGTQAHILMTHQLVAVSYTHLTLPTIYSV